MDPAAMAGMTGAQPSGPDPSGGGEGDDAHWYSWILSLIQALRDKDADARIPEDVQDAAPVPLKNIDAHNAALQQAYSAAGANG